MDRYLRVAAMCARILGAEVVQWEPTPSKFLAAPAGTGGSDGRATADDHGTGGQGERGEQMTLPGAAEALATWKVPSTLKDLAAEKKARARKGVRKDAASRHGGPEAPAL